MVSSQFTCLNKNQACKPLQNHLLFTLSPEDPAVNDNVELDFSDVFGPVQVQDSVEMDCGDLEISFSADVCELVYDEPAVICTRSHSFVGPSSLNTLSLKLGKLSLHDTKDSVDTLHCYAEETINEDISIDNEKPQEEINGKCQGVGTEDFEVLKVVGQGAFAKVYQVRKKGTSEIYAMKVMRKDRIMEKDHAEYMKAEKEILTKVEHPFIVQLKYSFQTKYRLYLILDFVNGGHLFFQLYHHGLFREDLARIYTAEIVSAVSHLHEKGIMHRDLKPENILLDADGHVMLTDFGLAKEFDETTRSNSLCGTVEYMAPEIILGKGHNKAADWWSVGILLYEMLKGEPPFHGNRGKVQQRIIKEKIKFPAFLTSEAHSLLKGLLVKEPEKRLGSGPTGAEEIKKHKWFKAINWKKLEGREIQPSFRPEVSGKLCVANFEKQWTDMSVLDSPAASPNSNSNPFVDFTYVRPPASFLQNSS